MPVMRVKTSNDPVTWVVVSGGGSGPSGTASFATLTGQPTDNANLATALNSKLNISQGTGKAGQTIKVNSSGNAVATSTPTVSEETITF